MQELAGKRGCLEDLTSLLFLFKLSLYYLRRTFQVVTVLFKEGQHARGVKIRDIFYYLRIFGR